MIYLDRPPGMADVGWTSSPQFWNSVANLAVKTGIEVAKKQLLELIIANLFECVAERGASPTPLPLQPFSGSTI